MISFRQVTGHDRDAISRLLSLAKFPRDLSWDQLESHISGWVAFAEGILAGFVFADRKQGELLVLFVEDRFSSKGIGSELTRQAESWLFSHGWSEINLTLPDKIHSRSSEFFRSLGWTESQPNQRSLRLKKLNPRSSINLEEHIIDDPKTGYRRIVRLQRGPVGVPHHLCLFLDGESYWRDMDVIPMLNEMLEEAKLPPMTIALVGHVSGEARQGDYICNEVYARFIGESVLPWLKSEVSSLDDRDHTICGLSLSGLMATYLTLLYPQHFAGCISQSGSHWWNPNWFSEMAQSNGTINSRFWLSVGDQETEAKVVHPPAGLRQEISQIEGVETVIPVLEKVGGTVYYHRYQGGHSYQNWRDELGCALQWIAPGRE